MGTPLPLGVADAEPELWDTVVLGGKESPGLAAVTVSRANKSDEKKAKGESGSTKEYSGADTAKVNVSIKYITAAEHEEFLKEILPVIEPNPEKKKVEAISISHPVATARSVKKITVDKVDGPNKSGDGIWEWTIEATEFRQPSTKNATGTFKGGPPKSNGCRDLAAHYEEMLRLSIHHGRLAQEAKEKLANAVDALYALKDAGVIADGDSGVGNPEVEQLKAEGQANLALSNQFKAMADATHIAMTANGCFEAKPSGNPNTTQP